MIYLITAFLIFNFYVAYCVYRHGMHRSISSIYYSLIDRKKWVTTAVYVATSGFALMAIQRPDEIKYLMIGAIFGLIMVGMAPHAAHPKQEVAHVVSAIWAIVFGITSMVFEYQNYWLSTLYVLFVVVVLRKWITIKNHTFWIELVAFWIICFVIFKDLL